MLRDLWTGGDGVADLAHRLGRSPDAVRLRARALGLNRPAVRRRWTAVEDATLRDGYADGLTCRRIADSLAERTLAAVAARARKLGLTTYARAWTAQDDSRLRRLAPLRSPAEIAQLLGRTPEAVRRRARTLGLTSGPTPRPPRTGARWSAEEDALVRLHAGMNPGALALRLGRSDLGVAARVRQLGAARRPPPLPTPSRTDRRRAHRRRVGAHRPRARARHRSRTSSAQPPARALPCRHPRTRRPTRTRVPIAGAQARRLKRIATAGTLARAGSGLRRHAGADNRLANRQRARPHARASGRSVTCCTCRQTSVRTRLISDPRRGRRRLHLDSPAQHEDQSDAPPAARLQLLRRPSAAST